MDRAVPTRLVVLGLIRDDGTLHGADLYDVAGACGMTDQQVRLCLRRLIAAGVLTQDGRGRRATFTAIAREQILPETSFVDLAYLQDAGRAPWDGEWRLIAFHVPEAQRAMRDGLRDHLRWLGAAQVHQGLYVSPHDLEPLLEDWSDQLAALGDGNLVVARSRALAVDGVSDPRTLARRLWPLTDLDQGYVEALRRLRAAARDLDRISDADAVLGLAFSALLAFTDAIQDDPLLPPDLLPRPWQGTETRRVMGELGGRIAARLQDGPEFEVLRLLGEQRAAA